MYLSRTQIEEIAVAVMKDFNDFFFNEKTGRKKEDLQGTPIDQLAKDYLGLSISFAHLSSDGNLCGLTAYVRVKNTGEVSAVNADTFRFLRREEKRLRRDITPDKPGETPSVRNEILHPLSLDYAIEGAYGDIAPAWAMDRDNSSEDALFNLLEEELIRSLTSREADVYKHCIVDGMKYLTYAKETGIDVANITRTVGRIRKRAKKLF